MEKTEERLLTGVKTAGLAMTAKKSLTVCYVSQEMHAGYTMGCRTIMLVICCCKKLLVLDNAVIDAGKYGLNVIVR